MHSIKEDMKNVNYKDRIGVHHNIFTNNLLYVNGEVEFQTY